MISAAAVQTVQDACMYEGFTPVDHQWIESGEMNLIGTSMQKLGESITLRLM